MKMICYDQFTTMRIRYKNGNSEEIAILAENETWWKGDWESYIMNMIAAIREQDSSIFENYESAFIIMPDWGEEGALIHEFTIEDECNEIYHVIHEINE